MLNSSKHHKQVAYEQAIAFRKRGFTYTEIAKICAVSRSTVSKWLAKEGFSQEITVRNKIRANKANSERIKLINKARKAERTKHYQAVLHQAEIEYKHYRHYPTFITGLALYYGLGDLKDPNLIRLSSARPELHLALITFVQEYLGVLRGDIRFWLALYKEHEPVACLKYWSKQTKISVSQFYKHQTINKRGNSKTALQFGFGNTIIGDTLLKKKLLHWIKLLEKEMKKK